MYIFISSQSHNSQKPIQENQILIPSIKYLGGD